MTYVPLGKFSSALDEMLYTLAASWDWVEDHDGDTEGFGAYAWPMSLDRESLTDEQLAEVAELATQIDPDDAELPNQIYGHWMISTNSQGFVYVEKMRDEDELDALWTAFKDSFDRWSEENPED